MARKGSKLSEEQKRHLSVINTGANHPKWGKKDSLETIEKKRKAITEKKRPPFSVEWKEKLSAARKGKKFSQEHKDKIRKALKGKKKRPLTYEERVKRSMAATGDTEFKGFKSPARKLLMANKEYKEWRLFIFKRDCYTCFECKKVGGDLHAHHLTQYSLRPDLALNYANGITLCANCHKKIPVIKKSQITYGKG
jgi:5-methylcytosine-specific restriction endonuclease McrA